eukprot:TRINITY_DN22546_c0_g1_i1.p1 TRINITY_DN22546_c0_g1~~TRINITY_DN22546_c0_g1_i1.p1  ORF type:complete len:374 (+),score=55.34 TRINITY_DN22546_c0_g1_i1:43-1164(+)
MSLEIRLAFAAREYLSLTGERPQWLALRTGVLALYSWTLYQVQHPLALLFFGFLFILWQHWDAFKAGKQQADRVLSQQKVPLRVSWFSQRFCAGGETNVPMRSASTDETASLVKVDFSDSEAVQRFDDVRRRVQCVFAAKAKIWGNDWSDAVCGGCAEDGDCSPEALLAANVALCIPRLLRFCLEVREGAALDGFVLEIRGLSYCSDLQHFTKTVRRVLGIISAADPSGADCLRRSYVSKRGWYFQFAREPLFVTTFAPCYPSSNPRYQFDQHPESCFILMQPEESFLRHDLPPDKPRSATNWEDPKDVRDRIRANFRKQGREYRIPETTAYPPAEFIVAATDVLTDPPVHFWRSSCKAFRSQHTAESLADGD